MVSSCLWASSSTTSMPTSRATRPFSPWDRRGGQIWCSGSLSCDLSRDPLHLVSCVTHLICVTFLSPPYLCLCRLPLSPTLPSLASLFLLSLCLCSCLFFPLPYLCFPSSISHSLSLACLSFFLPSLCFTSSLTSSPPPPLSSPSPPRPPPLLPRTQQVSSVSVQNCDPQTIHSLQYRHDSPSVLLLLSSSE